MTSYLDDLNDSQRAAVTYTNGPSLVIAGAGSGKTRVLTYKIAYLLEQGYKPWNILALTFTNKAAREMKERISQQVGEKLARYLWMGTFHSVFLRILRSESEHLGYNHDFTVYDQSDSRSLVKAIIKDLQLDENVYKPAKVHDRISKAKNHLVGPEEYAANHDLVSADREAKMGHICTIYKLYCSRCKRAQAMDFDDLLMQTQFLFSHYPEVLAKYQEQFQYILVDEYQDTNFVQHSIVQQLAAKHQRVCVVGDDAQSIYSFRGAEIGNILQFNEAFDSPKVFKLEQNYRSTKTIVDAANSLISKNSRQIKKHVFSDNATGDKICLTQAYSDLEEGEIISKRIIKLHNYFNVNYSDIAILYRTNAQSRIFEEAMRKKGIPYRIYGGLSFYQRKEIKDVIAYFRLLVNPNDEEAFKRIINYPARGIGDTTLKKIMLAANSCGASPWDVIDRPEEHGLDVAKASLRKVQLFHTTICELREKLNEYDAYSMGSAVLNASGIMAEITASNLPEDMSRKENINELLNGMSDYVQVQREEGKSSALLNDYLSEISLLTDQDNEAENGEQRVTIMTVHSAKGLEFDTVFIVGMEENLFPSPMATESLKELEEERRLFYVALTRAERRCFLSFAKNRFRYGKVEMSSPSRFLRDIDSCYINFEQEAFQSKSFTPQKATSTHNAPQAHGAIRSWQPSAKPAQTSQPQRTISFASPKSTLVKASSLSNATGNGNTPNVSVGQTIEHERFGRGEVIKVEGSGDNAKATIRFRNAGEKQLLLRFARFKIV